MAGVSISWLFSSFNAKSLGDHPGGITVFALAFVFGFSIDVFFRILDRLVLSLSKSLLAPA